MTKIKTDSNGKPPEFYPGDRVFVGPVQQEYDQAVVIIDKWASQQLRAIR